MKSTAILSVLMGMTTIVSALPVEGSNGIVLTEPSKHVTVHSVVRGFLTKIVISGAVEATSPKEDRRG